MTVSTPCLKTAGYSGPVADDQNDNRPASKRLADVLLARIDAGDYEPGDALPTYRQLATEFDVAVNTALAAVRILRDRGAVSIRPNAGARVRDRSEDLDPAAELHSLRDEVADLQSEAQRVSAGLARVQERLNEVAEQFCGTEG